MLKVPPEEVREVREVGGAAAGPLGKLAAAEAACYLQLAFWPPGRRSEGIFLT